MMSLPDESETTSGITLDVPANVNLIVLMIDSEELEAKIIKEWTLYKQDNGISVYFKYLPESREGLSVIEYED